MDIYNFITNYNYKKTAKKNVNLNKYCKNETIVINIENENELNKHILDQGLKYKFIKNLLPHKNIVISVQDSNIIDSV